MKYAYLDKYGNLKINPKKEQAELYSSNGKIVETDFPEIQGYPCDGTKAKQTSDGLGWDYSKCKMYTVKSAEEAYKVSDVLGKLYESVM